MFQQFSATLSAPYLRIFKGAALTCLFFIVNRAAGLAGDPPQSLTLSHGLAAASFSRLSGCSRRRVCAALAWPVVGSLAAASRVARCPPQGERSAGRSPPTGRLLLLAAPIPAIRQQQQEFSQPLNEVVHPHPAQGL